MGLVTQWRRRFQFDLEKNRDFDLDLKNRYSATLDMLHNFFNEFFMNSKTSGKYACLPEPPKIAIASYLLLLCV